MKKWIDIEREDLKNIPFMKENGFTKQFSYNDDKAGRTTPENVPHHPVNFLKADLVVWRIGQGWQTANLTPTKYINHKPFESLKEVIEALKNKEIKSHI